MLNRNTKLFLVFLALLLSVFVWSIKWLSSNEVEIYQQQIASHHSTAVASVSLLLANYDVTSQQGIAEFLQKLNQQAEVKILPELVAWQLLDANNQLLSQQKFQPEHHSLQHNDFNLYLKGPGGKLLTLKLVLFSPIKSGTSNILFELLLVAIMLTAVSLLAWNCFHWVFKSEAYARFIVNNNQQDNHKLRAPIDPISHSINQLLLKNSELQRQKNELTQQIRKISYVDEVTDLGNQLFFKAEFEVRLHNHEEAESGLFLLVSFSDQQLNGKAVVDDDLLSATANLLRHFIRDIPSALVARLRNNDFAVLLPNQTRENTDKLCRNLILQLDKSIYDATEIKAHFVDIGISGYKQGFDYYKILAEADMALRNAQLQGANNWYMYGESLSSHRVRGHIKWRSFLQGVLENRQIQLFGQKIHYYNQQQCKHYEVYVRIEDGKDILKADTFLPMANQCGLAVEFDRQVVDGVIQHCLHHEVTDIKPFYSVNLFIASLLDENFVTWLVKKLSGYPQICQQLCFEIKESHVTTYLNQLKKVFSQVAKLGVSWSIEKFGSPNETQDFLDLLPITRVKIDRRMINNIHSDKVQQLFLQSLMINLKSKNIDIYADGVEKEADAKYLMKSGIEAGQGYFYDKPQRLTRIEKYLKAI